MKKQKFNRVVIIVLSSLLSGCISDVWTGANLVYDRHNVYKKFHDYELSAAVNHELSINKTFQNEQCVLDIAVFHDDILIAGHVPTVELADEIRLRLTKVTGYRRLYNQVKVAQLSSNSVQDSWITAKIRSQIFADDSIDPNAFKIITSDRVVYIMGEAKADEANKVINIARYTDGVVRVVKMLRYFTYQESK